MYCSTKVKSFWERSIRIESDTYHLILQALVDDLNLSCLHPVSAITTKKNIFLYLLYFPQVLHLLKHSLMLWLTDLSGQQRCCNFKLNNSVSVPAVQTSKGGQSVIYFSSI